MANAGTLLTDLDGKMPIAGDNDLVNMIYKDMNSGPGQGQGAIPEMRPGGAIQMMPSPQTPHMNQMDTVPATAHIIGGQHPTAGDFATMLQSSSTGFAPSAWGSGAQGQQSPTTTGVKALSIKKMVLSTKNVPHKNWTSNGVEHNAPHITQHTSRAAGVMALKKSITSTHLLPTSSAARTSVPWCRTWVFRCAPWSLRPKL